MRRKNVSYFVWKFSKDSTKGFLTCQAEASFFLNGFLPSYHTYLISQHYTACSMTFVFYKEGKKYTVNNATLYDIGNSALDNFMITSTRGSFSEEDELENRELQKEVKEGIAWFHESVN